MPTWSHWCAAGSRATAIKSSMPQLVLLDVMLPKLDGFAVLQILRGEPRSRKLPVVMVTSFTRDRDVARGRELGANDYVVKPLMERDFMKRIERFIKA